ncbi:tRNA 2-thiouridine(34) synthase MnmA [Novispirillum sp. DQ9]|uniref:tRNA 2-thiouridine(34) synthase MnmA n=1 Tax=Novispirillum sp. DQ9 TaxID=3398612 RepID=UPI003C79749D
MDLPGRPGDHRVVVAMSGGVDSSVAAAVLMERGYDVIGVTMQLYDAGLTVGASRTCCAGQDIYDARRVADRLGIPHYVVDYEGTFLTDVMEAFADSYVSGETPVPCVLCNQTVKFRDMLGAARDLGAAALATGHYVRRVRGADRRPELWRGADHGRDQSYFLFTTTAAQMALLRFPLGALSKDETRALARRHGLAVADKPDSQDICFVPDGDYARVVESLRPGAIAPGEIVHVDGTVLGRHDGIIHFTVGQRRGLDIGGTADRLYVVRVDPATRRVIVGPREALGRTEFTLRAVNWLGSGERVPEDGARVAVKVRNSFRPAPATVFGTGATAARVVLDTPVEGVAPGQACVFYDGDRMLGGGWIIRDPSPTSGC